MTDGAIGQSIRQRLGPLWWHAALVFAASRIGDLLNLYTGLFFLPATLSIAELGAVDPVLRLSGFAAIPLTILSTVGVRYLSAWQATGETGKLRRAVRDLAAIGLGAGLLFGVGVAFLYRPIGLRLGVSARLLPALCTVGLFTAVGPLVRMVLQGTQRFGASCGVGMVDPAVRLLCAVLFVPALGLAGYLWGLAAAGALGLLLAFWAIRRDFPAGAADASYAGEWRGILQFAGPAAVFTLAFTAAGFVEPFAIKHFLSDRDAAGFYMACRFGLIPGYLAGAVGFVLFPLVTHRHERGEATERLLGQAVGATLVGGLAGVAVLGVCGRWILNLRPEWAVFSAYAPAVWKVALMATLDAGVMLVGMHEMACRRLSFVWPLAAVVLGFSAWLYLALGWGAARPFLPDALWQTVQDAAPKTLDYALAVMITSRLAQSGVLAWFWRFRAGRR